MNEYHKSLLTKLVTVVAALALSSIVAVHFRTYQIRPPDQFQFLFAKKAAEEKVIGSMRQFVERNLVKQFPNLTEGERKQVAEAQVRNFREQDPIKYNNVIVDTIDKNLLNVRYSPKGRIYLLEADPYYYYSLTEMIRKNGRLGDPQDPGFFHNPYRRAPFGTREEVNWHPYLGLYWGKFMERIHPGYDWVKALGLLPVALSVVSIAAFFFVGYVMRLNLISTCLGSLTLALSPMFLQRSCFGWYDTDPYNIIFPLIGIGLYVLALQSGGRAWLVALFAGMITGMYSVFWAGWIFLPGLLAVAGGLLCILDWMKGKRLFGDLFKITLLYLIFTALFAAVFMSPQRVGDSLKSWIWIGRYVRGDRQLWPNALFGTGEIASVTPIKLFYLTGNYLTLALAAIGTFVSGIKFLVSRDEKGIRNWITVMVFAVTLLTMCFRSERFTILFVVPFALLNAFGIEMIARPLLALLGKLLARWPRKSAVPLIVFFMLFALVAPFSFATANQTMTPVMPIMNDAWYDALTEIREKTPEDSIVYSWWPPGYFTIAVAQRRVLCDGGSQHRPEAYWIARILLSGDEREAAGIIRMLNSAGNDAAEYLNSLGWELPKVIDLIGRMVRVSREEGEQLIPGGLKPEEKGKFLEAVYGKGKSTPSYLMLYDDLIKQNIMMSVMARWDFAKAKQAHTKETRYGNAVYRNYVSYIMTASQDILKYTPESELINREGDLLSFANGLRVNLETMEAEVSISGKPYVPMPLFYMQDGQYVEKGWEKTGQATSCAMLIKNGQTYSSVLADAPLLRSMLFRLYYLNGEGLKRFIPFTKQIKPSDGGKIVVFEVNMTGLDDVAPVNNAGPSSEKNQAKG